MSEASSRPLRILVTGGDGQVGWELARTLVSLGRVTATGRADMDLTSDDSIRAVIDKVRPQLIVNAAAYTAVDHAESDPELARRINIDAVATLAGEAKSIGAAIIHYSTDYVFDGTKRGAYTEEDATNPLSVYGRTKLGGEQALAQAEIPYLILRTSWVYSSRGNNFLRTIFKRAAEKPELRIVNDQHGAPTWSRDIAQATAGIATQWLNRSLPAPSGIYHVTAVGDTTWYGFAKEALRMCESSSAEEGKFARLVPIATAEYPTPAARPKNSRLDCGKLVRTFGLKLPLWSVSLAAVVQELVIETNLGSAACHQGKH